MEVVRDASKVAYFLYVRIFSIADFEYADFEYYGNWVTPYVVVVVYKCSISNVMVTGDIDIDFDIEALLYSKDHAVIEC